MRAGLDGELRPAPGLCRDTLVALSGGVFILVMAFLLVGGARRE